MISLEEIITSDLALMDLENEDSASVIEVKLEPRDDDYEDIRSIHNSSVSSDPEKNKTYYCQRCLNHGLKFQRKGHKPECRYATCTCTLCLMVEQRRQINYELSIRKAELGEDETSSGGKRIRSPKCARCSAHGKKQALRGHKKVLCPFNKCTCDLCGLVESRRNLMARQIRIRRNQRKQQDKSDLTDSYQQDFPPLPKLNPSLISKPPLAKPTPIHVKHSSFVAKIQNQDSNSNDFLHHSRESSAFKEPNNNLESNSLTSMNSDSVNSMIIKHIQTLLQAQLNAVTAATLQFQNQNNNVNLQQTNSDVLTSLIPSLQQTTQISLPISPLIQNQPSSFNFPLISTQFNGNLFFPFLTNSDF